MTFCCIKTTLIGEIDMKVKMINLAIHALFVCFLIWAFCASFTGLVGAFGGLLGGLLWVGIVSGVLASLCEDV